MNQGLKLSAFFVVFVALHIKQACAQMQAVATLQNNGTNEIMGTVLFEQEGTTSNVTVTLSIRNVQPNSSHGFHVHQYGDTSNIRSNPPSTGYHFFPFCQPDDCRDDQTHGLPPSTVRHAGDMGNIQSDANGEVNAVLTIGEGKMSLNDSVRSILGRAIVIHALPDTGDQPYGHAGDVISAGVIGISHLSSGYIAPANPVTSVVCVLHAVQDLMTSPDFGAAGFVEIEHDDLTSYPHLKIKVLNATSRSLSFNTYLYGDMRNVPDSLGSEFLAGTLRQTPVTKFCETSGVYFDNILNRNEDISLYVGKGCAVLDGSTVIAAGVFGLSNPDNDKELFPEHFFSSVGASCTSDTPKKDKSSGLPGGAIAGIVIGVLAAVGLLVFFVHVSRSRGATTNMARTRIDEEYSRAPPGDRGAL